MKFKIKRILSQGAFLGLIWLAAGSVHELRTYFICRATGKAGQPVMIGFCWADKTALEVWDRRILKSG